MARRRRGEGFGFWGPLPSYSRSTRGGGRVRVTGCCLPSALGLASVAGLAPALLWRHARRR